jgi:tetrahydromethanopterin S-methyltransferase subunit F
MLRGVAEVFTERDISYRSAFIARELTLNSITNTTGISGPAIATCA